MTRDRPSIAASNLEEWRRIAERARRESDGDTVAAVRRCFQLLLVRDPGTDEQTSCLKLAEQYDLALVCRVILNSNEFVFIP